VTLGYVESDEEFEPAFDDRDDLHRLSMWKKSDLARVPNAQVVDFFSGAGGTSLGFSAHSFGFEILAGFEIDAVSAATFETNLGAEVFVGDLAQYDIEGTLVPSISELRDRNLPLVAIGCPPCQGFSAHTRTRPDHVDARNDLVALYAKILVSLDVNVGIMENVPELLTGPFSHQFERFREIVEAAGYIVAARVLDASKFGTPQKRKRAIVVVHRNEGWDPFSGLFEVSPIPTVRDAIADLQPVLSGGSGGGDSMHSAVRHKASTLDVIRAVPANGGSRPRGIGPASLDRVTGFTDVYGRLRWDQPSVTITKYARNPASGRFVHPEQDRGLTAREASRLQGFPDGFEFCGSRGDVYRQIGEAVPPPLGLSVAGIVERAIQLKQHTDQGGN
jgi:DNA (cytosine-5)-methyltransferase 1